MTADLDSILEEIVSVINIIDLNKKKVTTNKKNISLV